MEWPNIYVFKFISDFIYVVLFENYSTSKAKFTPNFALFDTLKY